MHSEFVQCTTQGQFVVFRLLQCREDAKEYSYVDGMTGTSHAQITCMLQQKHFTIDILAHEVHELYSSTLGVCITCHENHNVTVYSYAQKHLWVLLELYRGTVLCNTCMQMST